MDADSLESKTWIQLREALLLAVAALEEARNEPYPGAGVMAATLGLSRIGSVLNVEDYAD